SDVAGTTVDPIEGYIDLYFGAKVEKLLSRDDQFRKSNLKLYQEFQEFEEEFSKEEMLAYDELPEEYKSGSDDDSDDELCFDGDDDNSDLYSLEDNIDALEVLDDESTETEDEEKIETEFNPFRSIKIVDTAGIRKHKLVKDFIESQSVYRSLKAISEADVVIYMV